MRDDSATVTARLTAALRDSASPWAGAALVRLPDKGLAHDHVRITGSGLLARIPKQSQMRLTPADNLAYQAACFQRAAAGGHAPRLHGVLAPCANLPRGALLVQEVQGRTAALPGDLAAIVQALAALHALPLPAPAARRRAAGRRQPGRRLRTARRRHAQVLGQQQQRTARPRRQGRSRREREPNGRCAIDRVVLRVVLTVGVERPRGLRHVRHRPQ